MSQETGVLMINPFSLKATLLARHAQHVVLIHFPIALFISAVVFDWIAHRTKKNEFADTAYYSLLAAAISALPVLVTGIFAWRFQLEGQKLKGILLWHVILACLTSVTICWAWWLHFRARYRTHALPKYRLAVELVGVGFVVITAHLGGVLSGVIGT